MFGAKEGWGGGRGEGENIYSLASLSKSKFFTRAARVASSARVALLSLVSLLSGNRVAK